MSLYSNQLELLNQKFTEINKNIEISFEFFPPKTKKLKNQFWNNINKISKLKPNFFSVTCSSFSGNPNTTLEITKKIKSFTGIKSAPHLTCINLSKKELCNIAQNYLDNNIKNVIALRGDTNNNKINKKRYGLDLVILLKKIGDFDISVAAYPEVHPEANNAKEDLINLKNKIHAGANRAITQFFFDVEKYLRFRDRCISIGINVDIIPGILPIFNFIQLKHFASMTNVNIPNWIHKMYTGIDDNLSTRKIIGANIAIDMVKILINEGVKKFHFYTLNEIELCYAICHLIKL